jgi:hypothetical protein
MRRPIGDVDATAQASLVCRGRDADLASKQRAERPQAGKADVQADVRHRITTREQSLRHGKSFSGSELVRRFTEYGIESADEVEWGQARLARCISDREVRGPYVRKQISSPTELQEGSSVGPSVRSHFIALATGQRRRASSCIGRRPVGTCTAPLYVHDRAVRPAMSEGGGAWPSWERVKPPVFRWKRLSEAGLI